MRAHTQVYLYNGDDKCPLPPGPIVSGRTGRATGVKVRHIHVFIIYNIYIYIYICTHAQIILCAPIGSADSNMSKSPVRPPSPAPGPAPPSTLSATASFLTHPLVIVFVVIVVFGCETLFSDVD